MKTLHNGLWAVIDAEDTLLCLLVAPGATGMGGREEGAGPPYTTH